MSFRRSLALIAVMFCVAGFGIGASGDGHDKHGAKHKGEKPSIMEKMKGKMEGMMEPAAGREGRRHDGHKGPKHHAMGHDHAMKQHCHDKVGHDAFDAQAMQDRAIGYRTQKMDRTAGSIAVYGRSTHKCCDGMSGHCPGMEEGHKRHHEGMAPMKGRHAEAGPSAMDDAVNHMNHSMNKPSTGNADADYVRGMIAHHQGAIDMARAVLKNGHDEQVRAQARGVIKAQKAEIAEMRQWLHERHIPENGPYHFQP